MARRRLTHRIEHARLKTGVFLAFSLALFMGMYFLYGKLDRVWRGVIDVRVLFTMVKKLKPLAPVRYDGMELGRVKDVRIVHASLALLAGLAPFKKGDLSNLPLTERERAELSLLPAEDFNAAVRQAIKDRSMIEVTLTLLIEDDEKRLHVDDRYVIKSTYLDESSVEIETGRGEPVPPRNGLAFLGINADLLSDIDTNMADISLMLGSWVQIIGADDRKEAIHTQIRDIARMTGVIDENTRSIGESLPAIWDGIDARTVESEKGMRDIASKILGYPARAEDRLPPFLRGPGRDALKPQIDAALKKTDAAIASMRQSLVQSADEGVKYLKEHRKLVLEQVGDFKKSVGETRESMPRQFSDLRGSSENALAAAAKFDDMLERVEEQMKDTAASARLALGAQSDAAMKTQERIWHFKNAPASLSAKSTPRQLLEKHADWRYDMVRRQYAELRRELAAIQAGMGVGDPADRERARHVEELLAASDGFFELNRANYPVLLPPALNHSAPDAEVKPGEPVPVPPPVEVIDIAPKKSSLVPPAVPPIVPPAASEIKKEQP